MLARKPFRIWLFSNLPLEEPVYLTISDDVVLLLQAVDGDGHAEPDGVEHDECDPACDIALAHAGKAGRFRPSERET